MVEAVKHFVLQSFGDGYIKKRPSERLRCAPQSIARDKFPDFQHHLHCMHKRTETWESLEDHRTVNKIKFAQVCCKPGSDYLDELPSNLTDAKLPSKTSLFGWIIDCLGLGWTQAKGNNTCRCPCSGYKMWKRLVGTQLKIEQKGQIFNHPISETTFLVAHWKERFRWENQNSTFKNQDVSYNAESARTRAKAKYSCMFCRQWKQRSEKLRSLTARRVRAGVGRSPPFRWRGSRRRRWCPNQGAGAVADTWSPAWRCASPLHPLRPEQAVRVQGLGHGSKISVPNSSVCNTSFAFTNAVWQFVDAPRLLDSPVVFVTCCSYDWKVCEAAGKLSSLATRKIFWARILVTERTKTRSACQTATRLWKLNCWGRVLGLSLLPWENHTFSTPHEFQSSPQEIFVATHFVCVVKTSVSKPSRRARRVPCQSGWRRR